MSLVFEGVTKSFGRAKVLRSLDLTLESGTLMTVLGPSGGGKTTMLRVAAGLETPTSGAVTLNGTSVRLGDASVAFQDTPLYPHLTVMENILFPLRLKSAGGSRVRRDSRGQREAAQAVLDMMHIPDLGPRRIHELSGGQKQRVGIARALVRDVGLYLFDEPLAHLDQSLAREIREDLREIQRKTGLTMLYVTHQVEEAFALGDTVAILNEGRLEQVGTPHEIWRRPATHFVAGFLGSYPMNFVAGEGEVIRGFRPENCVVVKDADHLEKTDPPSDRGLSFHGTVATSSFLGEATLVDFDPVEPNLGPLRALVPSGVEGRVGAPPQAGDAARLRVHPEHVHEFEKGTGRRIG
ncbi:ABC transporter ATP-binding protein [Rothia uropygioeca]|uniref:ABC transporter ATP-binding protein n=1 Tax=Kocuria sp. 257 TaxID=2021970 RepID=UPI001012B650|nr:ABC transporter ATP-binding protein [Kocuria sp. 257]